MSKIITYTLLSLLVIISLVVIIGCSSNPLQRSNEEIRESILKITPIGTSMDEVIKVVENNKEWKISWKNYEQGYVDYSNKDTVVGKKSINVYIGKYSGEYFFTTRVEAFYGFNERSELIDVWISKTTDSL